ncbi:MAG TPA: sulfatase-like hydrolase/transferase [Terracidiphilus sp.]|nr:sulfatase-like hydrolase/transferase [Terracidiphilus sp.]
MDRRTFCTLTAGAFAGNGLLNAQVPSAAGTRTLHFAQQRTGMGAFSQDFNGKPPHIVLISADMVSPDLYHPDRSLSRNVHIPAIRSLMQDGCFFSNAFCTVPLCSPSRASYLTGRYSYILGNGEHAPDGLQTELRDDDIIFPEYLRAAGYLTRQVGKCHVGAKKFLDAFGENDQPWDRWAPPVSDDDDFLTYQRKLGVKPQKYTREIVFRQQDRTTPGNSVGGWVVQQDGKPFPLEAQYSYYLGRKTIQTIDDLVARGSAERHPVYLQLDLFDPHQPFAIPAGSEEREKELRRLMILPASYEEAKKRDWQRANDEPEIIDVYRRYWGIYNDAQLLDYRVAYILQMEIVDRVIGMVLQKLKDCGLYDNALIAFISDHGEMNGRRALVDKGVFLYPDVLRVPLILKPPRNTAKFNATVSSPASLLDLSQTLLEAAGIQAEAKFDGVSLLPHMLTENANQERTLLFFGGWHVGVNFACGLQHRFPDGRHFLYAYNCTSTVDELYDLSSEDAFNLIDRPEYAEIGKEMIRRLGTALQSDPRWSGYWGEFRLARFASLPVVEGDMQLLPSTS